MAYVITDECKLRTMRCECPSEAISEGADHFEIDADACVDCGTCADVCPTEVIQPENNPTDYIQKRKEELAANAAALLFYIFSCIFRILLIFYPLKWQGFCVWQVAVL